MGSRSAQPGQEFQPISLQDRLGSPQEKLESDGIRRNVAVISRLPSVSLPRCGGLQAITSYGPSVELNMSDA